MRNEGLKCTRNDYAKYCLLRHILNALTSNGDFIINNILTSES